jgi:hypothetical protein
MQVKIFYYYNDLATSARSMFSTRDHLEADTNEWLLENPSITINHILQSSDHNGTYISIFYTL